MDLNFLLFSAMMNPAEVYLSKNDSGRSRSLKILSNPKRRSSEKLRVKSLDSEIEKAIDDITKPNEGVRIESFLTDIDNKNQEVMNKNYFKNNNLVQDRQASPKNLYNTIAKYAKGAYEKAESALSEVAYATRKVVEGPVRLTMEKFIKVWQYVLAALNPQWNMPTLSKWDYDSLAPSVTNHVTISSDNSQFESGYEALRYRPA
jgi:hypothetical protein